jgi:hypothetical protein
MVCINFVSVRTHAKSPYVTSSSFKILHLEDSLSVSKRKGVWARKFRKCGHEKNTCCSSWTTIRSALLHQGHLVGFTPAEPFLRHHVPVSHVKWWDDSLNCRHAEAINDAFFVFNAVRRYEALRPIACSVGVVGGWRSNLLHFWMITASTSTNRVLTFRFKHATHCA